MNINGLEVIQLNNCYRIFTPQGIHIADVLMPNDGQLLLDAKGLELFTKPLAMRWGVIKPQNRSK